MLILPLNNEDHERRLRERGIYTEEQIARTLKRADMYVQHNQEHPGFFDMMICSGKSYSLPSVSPFCLLLFVVFFHSPSPSSFSSSFFFHLLLSLLFLSVLLSSATSSSSLSLFLSFFFSSPCSFSSFFFLLLIFFPLLPNFFFPFYINVICQYNELQANFVINKINIYMEVGVIRTRRRKEWSNTFREESMNFLARLTNQDQ